MKKKIISVVLAVVMVLSCFCMMSFASTKAEDAHLKFNDNGKFKVINFTDIQNIKSSNLLQIRMIKQIVKDEKPDLVVLTGDNIAGNHKNTIEKAKKEIDKFMKVFDEAGVPVAIVYGNHDAQGEMTKEQQMEYYNTYKCNISCDQDDWWKTDLTGCGNYNIPIYAHDDSKVAFNLWMMDSGMNDENGDYDRVHSDQLLWYKAKSTKLALENGGLVPSICFQHIIVPEIWDALKEVPTGTKAAFVSPFDGKTYALPDGTGVMGEHPCPGMQNDGQFEIMKKQGDVKAIAVGHDHDNAFDVPYEGIHIISCPRVQVADELGQNVATVFEINEDGTFTNRFVRGADSMNNTLLGFLYMIIFTITDIARGFRVMFG